jgi:YHS domain-containing protein
MDVVAARAPGLSYSGRRVYHFCSIPCKQRFDANPDYFVEKMARAQIEERHRYGKSPGRRAEQRRRLPRLQTAFI